MALTYNSNSLQSSTIITEKIDYHSAATRNVKMLPIAHANLSKVTSVEIPTKTIKISGTLNAASITAMDALEDTFKGYMTGFDKNLDIDHNGATRRFVASPTNIVVDRPSGLNWAKFSVDFICSSPFGIDTSSTALVSGTAVTTATATWSITTAGTAQYQYPVITVTLVSGTQLTGQSMSIGNNMNGQICTITRNWVAGDVVVITPATMMVTVNGTEVEFSGSIPIFDVGTGSISYSDTFLTRSINYSALQYKYWA